MCFVVGAATGYFAGAQPLTLDRQNGSRDCIGARHSQRRSAVRQRAMAVEKAEPMDAVPRHSPQPPARVRHPMVEANIGESPRGSRPKVFPRTRSSGGARATPRHRDRASPTVAFAPRRSSSPRAAPVRPSRRAVPTLSRPDRSKPKRNSSSKLTARFFPPASPFPNRSAVSRPARREALAD